MRLDVMTVRTFFADEPCSAGSVRAVVMLGGLLAAAGCGARARPVRGAVRSPDRPRTPPAADPRGGAR
ncbi:hypothetical protein GCM10020366_40950 [Saccharopolyspora gregorii]|uniref:Uncharacterized protein n=1 Tax=Saccharopolyspora gregorii TaxID=33914 RepID=A0ABP6RUJ8_9PSEU